MRRWLIGLILLVSADTLRAQDLDYSTWWIGNSFGGADNAWVQLAVEAMIVLPDGTVVTNSPWDESGREVGIYRDGQVIALADDLHGWGRGGGLAVAADDQYLYVAMGQGGCDGGDDSLNVNDLRGYPPCGTVWHSVRRYRWEVRGGRLWPEPFDGGYGWNGDQLVVDSEPADRPGQPLTGLAIHDGELYVSSPRSQAIRVYALDTLTQVRQFPLDDPDQLVVDADGMLWAISGSTVVRLTRQGERLPQTIPGVVRPTALAIDAQNRLLVADDGPDQQVKIFGDLNTTPVLVGTLGERGGRYAGVPGQVGPLRFHHLRGVGVDAAGNTYVAMSTPGGGTEIESYTPDGQRRWALLGLTFVDNADVDPASDAQSVYTVGERYTIDYDAPSWTYVGTTLDPFRFPDDPRLRFDSTSVFFRRVNGVPLLFITGMYSGPLAVYRFDPDQYGELAIPAALFNVSGGRANWRPDQPQEPWLWVDANGNGQADADEYETFTVVNPYAWGWWIDSDGTIWRAFREDGLLRLPLTGFSTAGVPLYRYADGVLDPNPAPFDQREGYRGDINRVLYDPAADRMILTGYTTEFPNAFEHWGLLGRDVVIYDDWMAGARQPSVRWQPNYSDAAMPVTMDAAGEYLFVGVMLQYETTGARVDIYHRTTGAFVGTLSPGPEVGGVSGWIDIPFGLRAWQRQNGEFVILVEEDARAKILLYRWRPG